jgi:hypothetical protein
MIYCVRYKRGWWGGRGDNGSLGSSVGELASVGIAYQMLNGLLHVVLVGPILLLSVLVFGPDSAVALLGVSGRDFWV